MAENLEEAASETKFQIMNQNLVERKIDWDKVVTFEDFKNVLIAMNLVIWDDEEESPDHQVACIRYLFLPKETHED